MNARNQLSATTQPDGTSIAYTYDAQGHRIQQNLNNGQALTDYVWDTLSPYGDVVMEQAGGVATHYTFADGMLLTQTRSATASYYLTDAQGSTRLLTNPSGTVSDTYAYTAFGELRHQTGTTPNAYRYTGQQFDALTGLYSLRARTYAPSAGRFLSTDTWAVDVHNPVELNRYVYAVNNPVRWGDPSGLSPMGNYGKVLAKVAGTVSNIVSKFGKVLSPVWTQLSTGFLGSTLGGGLQAFVGYLAGLMYYNIETKGTSLSSKDIIAGFDWDTAVNNVIWGFTQGAVNWFIQSFLEYFLIGDKEVNKLSWHEAQELGKGLGAGL